MINGITVLDTASIIDIDFTVCIVSIIFFSVGVLCAFLGSAIEHDEIIFTGAVFIVIGLIFFLTWVINTPSVGYNEYKVTIDETVSLNEFNSKYEIIEQEGKIYTIIEKEK